MFEEITQPLSSLLGIESSLLGILLVLGVGIAIFLMAYQFTGSFLFAQVAFVGPLVGGFLLGIVPFWIVLLVGLFTVSHLGFRFFFFEGEKVEGSPTSVEGNLLRKKLEEVSQQFSKYHNNLDKLLGVVTFTSTEANGLLLTKNSGLLIGERYNWYIVHKEDGRDSFTVVGLDKANPSSCKAYLLGKNSHTNLPYLTRVRKEEGLKWVN